MGKEPSCIWRQAAVKSADMELESRAGEDMAAKANIPNSNGSLCMTSVHRIHASPDVGVPTFVNQHYDMGFPLYENQQHLSSAEILAHAVAATRHQVVCPITSHSQVMTDEQLETLRRQISVYATICQQLVEMHKAIMAHQSSTSGLWLGPSIPFDSSLHSIGHKLTSRQRWTPSQSQLHILERLFEEESGTPNKQRIKEITIELSQHGQISETNVYNWFQNRRARTKRKQNLGGPNNGDSELDTDVDLPEEKKGKTEGDSTNYKLEGISGAADNTEHCHRLSELSQRHAHHSMLPLCAPIYLSEGVDKSLDEWQANCVAESKLRDRPLNSPESKANFTGFSLSREFQGRQIIATGAESHH